MKIRVLIVDDEFTLAETVAEMLAERGYDTHVAINGKLGLDRLRADGAHLVMMDVMMPIMDGPTLLREMRRDPALRDIPVVMMTAVPEALPADEPPLHQGTLVKPFSPDSMFRLVDRLVNGQRR